MALSSSSLLLPLSSSSLLLPLSPPDLLHPSLTAGSPSACSRPCSRPSSSHSLWISSERPQFAVMAGKGKREKMDFFLDDFDERKEDKIPDDVVDMEEWMRNRPSGFGVDKEYDLALEEKLLAEIEADKKAREAAKARKGLGKADQGRKIPKASKVTEAPPGVEVWVGNLPRKRKVDRDLRAVFRNAPGLLHIRPIVEPENEKTREPMCRGFAFFTFATEDDAYDFVEKYHGEKVKFGKVDKKIACEVAKSDSPWHPKPNSRSSSTISVPKLQVRYADPVMEPKLPSTPTKILERELDSVTAASSSTIIMPKSLGHEEVEEDEELNASETKLRAMEEEIWDQFEDEDDIALDLELSQEEVDDEDEPSHTRSGVDEHELSEPVESARVMNINVKVSDLRASGRKVRTMEDDDEDDDDDDDDDEDDYSVEKIKELEAKVREMERKLQLTTQDEEQRIALLETRVLNKAKSAVGVSTTRGEGEKKKTGAKKNSSKAGKKMKPKSDKPKIGSLGSASRLKAKERAILTGVMTKYVSSSI